MSESMKVVCAMCLTVTVPVAIIAWLIAGNDLGVWLCRIIPSVISIVLIAAFVKSLLQADRVHDYLHDRVGKYFNRDGFCFQLTLGVDDGIAHIDAYFQNQYDQPLLGGIAIRPAPGFFGKRADLKTAVVAIDCEPAAYGFARIPIAVPEKLQGRYHYFEVGAFVDYPQGKGQRLRFREGKMIRTNVDFGESRGLAKEVLIWASGFAQFTTPEQVALTMPACVASEVSDEIKPAITTLWRLGDASMSDRERHLAG